jgi:cytoskeletal protein RodZ
VTAIVVLAAVAVATAIVSWARARRHGGGDSITRHGRALETLRDIYEETTPAPTRTRSGDGAVQRAGAPTGATVTTTLPPEPARDVMAGLAHTVRPNRRRGGGRPALVATAAVVVLAAAAIGAVLVVNNDGDDGDRTTTTTTTVAARTTTTPAPTTASTTPAAPAIVDREGVPTVVVAPPFTLTISATASCWTEVHDDAGTTLFAGTVDEGESETIEATTPVELTLGNATAATVQVNGTTLDTATLPSTVDITFAPA